VELWIPLAIAAAFLQNIRSTLQKSLKDHLSDTGAAYVRFAFGVPVVLLYLVALLFWQRASLPEPNVAFAAWGATGGVAQIVGTVLLLQAFSSRSFAVSTAYSKTEPLQVALFGIVLLGEFVPVGAVFAIGISLVGVLLLGAARRQSSSEGLLAELRGRGALRGLLSGSAFAVAAVCYRAASLSLPSGGVALRAATTLAGVICFQALLMTVVLYWREPGELRRVAGQWRAAVGVGLCGALASMGWFSAMTLTNAAYVRAVGQVELIFALFSSAWFFREPILRLEWLGIGAILAGVLLLALSV
jgi:drug/metabolite transporter (DMT)-like permease